MIRPTAKEQSSLQTWPNSDLLLFSHKPDPMVTCCSPTNLTQQSPPAVLPQRICLKKFWQVNDLCRKGKQTQTTGTHMRGTELPTPNNFRTIVSSVHTDQLPMWIISNRRRQIDTVQSHINCLVLGSVCYGILVLHLLGLSTIPDWLKNTPQANKIQL